MRIVVQRVSSASVSVGGEVVGEIGAGLLLLVGIGRADDADTVAGLARKCAEMRIFADEQGRFDCSLPDLAGEALVVLQFTLLADVRKGRRPRFIDAAQPEVAAPLVDAFAVALKRLGIRVATGRFGAMMRVELVNDGPVTIIVDSNDLDRPRSG